jgi:ferric-dicitrate binding protein FerR (iron transport regulator)
MKRRNFRIPDRLLRYLTGISTRKDQKIIEAWKNTSAENRQLADDLDDPAAFSKDWKRFNDIDIEARWKSLQPRLNSAPRFENPVISISRRYAAVWITALLAAAALVLYTLSGHRHETIVQNQPGTSATTPVTEPVSLMLAYEGHSPVAFDDQLGESLVRMEDLRLSFQRRGRQLLVSYLNAGASNRKPFTVSSPAGGDYEVILPDSSTVLMNAMTDLTIGAGYGLQTRNTRLKGEANFVVKPVPVETEPSLAFTVDVVTPEPLKHLFRSMGMEFPGLSITVRGTNFDVRANPDDRSIRAMLLHGKIEVRRPDMAPKTIGEGSAYILGENGLVRIVQLKDLAGQDSWKRDEFDFNNQPVGVIMAELSRWYGVPIKCPADFTDPFVFSGSRSQPVRSILEQLKATRHFNYKITRDTIYVSR